MTNNAFIGKIKRYIKANCLFTKDDNLIVAISGGADSVAMLTVLNVLGYQLHAAHCNFHLRGQESDRDERFVRELCNKLGIPLSTKHFDTNKHATECHISIEMAARELRYQWFEQLRQEIKAQYIAVAHHEDDCIETFLMNILRGTGVNGLKGIMKKNGYIVRPMLCVSRKDITGFLGDICQDYVTDSTNLQDEYTRNKIRLNLIPLMENINPSARQNILTTISNLEQAHIIYKKAIDDGKKRALHDNVIDIDVLKKEPSPTTLLHEIISPLGYNAPQVKDIITALDGQPGKIFNSGEWTITKDRRKLIIDKKVTESLPEIIVENFHISEDFKIIKDRNIACLDADKLHFPLKIREWEHGDSFVPYGMKGTKLISDYLTDIKLPSNEKEHQAVVTCGDKIVWVVGQRIDNNYRVSEKTKEVTIVRVLKNKKTGNISL